MNAFEYSKGRILPEFRGEGSCVIGTGVGVFLAGDLPAPSRVFLPTRRGFSVVLELYWCAYVPAKGPLQPELHQR